MGTADAADLLSVYRDALVSDSDLPGARAPNTTRRASAAAGTRRLPAAHHGTAARFRNDINLEIAPDQRYSTTTTRSRSAQPVIRHAELDRDLAGRQAGAPGRGASRVPGRGADPAVAQAYFDVLLAQDNVALSGAQKTAISEQLAQAKRNFEVGTSTIVDTLEAQARYDQSPRRRSRTRSISR
jgi:outer membrane protein